MANEIKNRSHAIATFVGVDTIVAPFTKRIVNSVGLDGVTRNGPGNYTAKLTDAIGFSGATLRADLPANFLGIAGAQLAADGGSVLITVFDLSGAPADPPLVSFEVVSVVEGEGVGPAPVLPDPPTPGGGGFLFGWARVSIPGDTIVAQSANNPILSVSRTSTGTYDYILIEGLPALATVVGQAAEPGFAFTTTAVRSNDAAARVEMWDTSTNLLANGSNAVFLYSV